MPCPSYVLVTPALNEEATIEETIRSVFSQTWLPAEWVIVSDGSTDNTDEIIRRYAVSRPFIRLLRLDARPARNFASVVFALESGIKALQTDDYDFLGLLDADVRFKPGYFETLIGRFDSAPRLGLAGGLVLDLIDGRVPCELRAPKDVAGAVQFFRRECFCALGGLIAIPEGGWDAITNVQTRASGFDTQTFSDLLVDHLKPRNSAEGGAIRRKWQLGVRDYVLGYGLTFEIGKCLLRWRERPRIIAALAWLAGFCWSALCRRRRVLAPSIIAKIRQEQRLRMRGRSQPRGARPAA